MKIDKLRKSASARARRGLRSLRRSKNMCNDHCESDRHEERRASQERERESATKAATRVIATKSDERRKSASTVRAQQGPQSLRRSKNMCNDHCESDRHEERRASQERERESATRIAMKTDERRKSASTAGAQ
jgi:hypothetical protein